ncbi:MAG: hypothetical protein MI743_08895 [Sneathiellales bacterium]|nr:hypothetical protein [Sneathiellales bacterium]
MARLTGKRMKRIGFVVGLAILSAGQALADFQAGLDAYNKNDFTGAVRLWTEEGFKGDLNSQYNLGLLFERGAEGVPKDLATAYGWYRLAAAQDVTKATEALARIKPIMTAGQIERGNQQAIEAAGKWFRTNVGVSEADFQKAKADAEAKRKEKIAEERKAAAARAQRQRELIAQRSADAKVAQELERQSREAAIRAAQEKAEEAKRKSLIEQRRREEEERLAALKAEQDKQRKLDEARQRLAALQAKQQGKPVPVQQVAPKSKPAPQSNIQTQKVITPKSRTEKAPAAAPTAPVSTAAIAAPAKPASAPVPSSPAAAPAPAPAASSSVPVAKTTSEPTAAVQNEPEPVRKSEPVASATEVKEALSEPKPTIEKEPEPKPQDVQKQAVEKRVESKVEPGPAKTVAAKPATVPKPAPVKKTTMPVIENGLDKAIVEKIIADSNSVPLDTPQALAEIDKGRTDIEALKWSLISAARGKGSAKTMNSVLSQNMTPAQIAQANALAAEWISKRQKRR